LLYKAPTKLSAGDQDEMELSRCFIPQSANTI